MNPRNHLPRFDASPGRSKMPFHANFSAFQTVVTRSFKITPAITIKIGPDGGDGGTVGVSVVGPPSRHCSEKPRCGGVVRVVCGEHFVLFILIKLGINPKSPQNICLHPGFDTFLKYSPRSPSGPLHEPEIADNPNYSPNQPISGPTNKTNAHV